MESALSYIWTKKTYCILYTRTLNFRGWQIFIKNAPISRVITSALQNTKLVLLVSKKNYRNTKREREKEREREILLRVYSIMCTFKSKLSYWTMQRRTRSSLTLTIVLHLLWKLLSHLTVHRFGMILLPAGYFHVSVSK